MFLILFFFWKGGSFKNLEPIYSSAKKIGVSYSNSSSVISDIIIQKLVELKNGLIKKSKVYWILNAIVKYFFLVLLLLLNTIFINNKNVLFIYINL